MHIVNFTARVPLALGAALLVTACGGGTDGATNNVVANDLESNLMLDAPGNDASAMESVTNVAEPLPTANVGEPADAANDASAGETVESNVAGM